MAKAALGWARALTPPLATRCFLPTNGPAGLPRFARLAAEAQDVRAQERSAENRWCPARCWLGKVLV